MAKTKDDTKTGTDVAVAETKLPADLQAAYGGQPSGFENDRVDDFVIPFYTILQGISPQVAAGIGLPGKIINVSTNELFEKINLVAVRKVVQFIEWRPNRGGFVAAYPVDHPVVAECKAAWQSENPGENVQFAKLVTKAGNDLMETKYIYGVLADENKKPMGYGVIGFSSTKIKKFNAWNTDAKNKLGQFGLPLHALVWTFGVTKERNEKGEFYNWGTSLFGGKVDFATVSPSADADLFQAVAALMKRSDVKIDHSKERGDEGGAAPAGDNDAM